MLIAGVTIMIMMMTMIIITMIANIMMITNVATGAIWSMTSVDRCPPSLSINANLYLDPPLNPESWWYLENIL